MRPIVVLSMLQILVAPIVVRAQGIVVKSMQVPAEYAVERSMEAVYPTERMIERARSQGMLHVERDMVTRTVSHISADIGDHKEFRVYNFSTAQPETIEFELMVIDESVPPQFQVWMEAALLGGDGVHEESVDAFVDYLGTHTPPSSWNEDEGIVRNMETILGGPPDVDGDGITEFLLLDIRDGWDGNAVSTYIPSFINVDDLRGSSNGNSADIVYVDTHPGLSGQGPEFISSSVAVNLANLVMINNDPVEIPFIYWGLVSWAPVALGFAGRQMEYLDLPDRYNRGLFEYVPTFGEFTDQRRGELFLNYIADEFGALNAGSIARVDATGSQGLRIALEAMDAGVTLEELVENFHAANGVNFRALPHYGYISPARSNVRATAHPVYNTVYNINGGLGAETPATRIAVAAGGVAYIEWQSVKDFSLSVTLDATLDATNDVNGEGVRAVIFPFVRGQDLAPFVRSEVPSDGINLDGNYERVLLVLAHTNPDGEQRIVSYSAKWEPTTVELAYDSGRITDGNIFTLSDDSAEHLSATQFDTPILDGRETTLETVWVSHYYLNQMELASYDAPRDFELIVWGPGENDRPGTVLFRQEMEDTRPYGAVTLNLQFLEIDMTPYVDHIGPLPDIVYIGTAEAGSDGNYHLIAPSPHEGATKNRSFLYVPSHNDWQRLWDVQFQDSDPDPLVDNVLGTRVRFRLQTTTGVDVETDEMPQGVQLDGNYPNPFNEVTRITYHLNQQGPVHLSVMDLLGRRIEVLVDAEQGPGEHHIAFDGAHLSNGVYIYRLEHPGGVEAHRMVLVR